MTIVLWMTMVVATVKALVHPMAPSLRILTMRRGHTFPPLRRPCNQRRIAYMLFGGSARRCTKQGDGDAADDGAAMTVRQIYNSSLKRLQNEGISEPEWSVAHLLASAMELPWSNGFSHLQRTMESGNDKILMEQQLTLAQSERYQSMLERRLKDEPLQYILGKWDFLDYEEIVVRPPLLCPRPETEELVELVRKDIQQQQQQQQQLEYRKQQQDQEQPWNILDVGCGTGVIGIALADTIQHSRVVAIDIEPIALATSLENAKLILGSNFAERYAALEVDATDYKPPTDHQFDVVVSNPPYIPRDDMMALSRDVVDYESDRALCGGSDGMDVIRTIVCKWAKIWGKKPTSVCWMEVDPSHPSLLGAWLEKDRALGVALESTHQDLSGRDRFVKLSFRSFD
jgi:release factor glutamine methyltransferase